jgi:Arc/MetJ-type ribon-helix-helix transcriptional regulator
MSASVVTHEKLQLTLSLPHDVAENIRTQVASGAYSSESEYVEALLLSETLFAPIDQDDLTHWMNTEGVRRLEAMKADPSQCLSHEEFWANIEADDQEVESTSQNREAA